jgi:hypothetical protein
MRYFELNSNFLSTTLLLSQKPHSFQNYFFFKDFFFQNPYHNTKWSNFNGLAGLNQSLKSSEFHLVRLDPKLGDTKISIYPNTLWFILIYVICIFESAKILFLASKQVDYLPINFFLLSFFLFAY